MTLAEFSETLRPLVTQLKGVPLVDPSAAVRELERRLPFGGELIGRVRKEAEAGAREGWLLPKQNGAVRFGRVAKDLEGFSVDAVWMSTPGPRHRHGNGEIDLCFATRGAARFDGHPEGWVAFAPGSVHIPTVSEGEMLILYFLPGGAIEFL
jgi:hypothetical protein